jgi:uncharacterized protein YoxC
MKKIIILLVLSLFLVSCGNSEEGIIDESIETVDTYVDTLESSVQGAREAAETMNAQQAALEESLNIK